MTQLVAILNLTPDSFSDGNEAFCRDKALNKAIALINDGCDVLDIGAESTRPGAKALTPEEEWLRLESILPILRSTTRAQHKQLSLDSRHPQTIEKAIKIGIDWINDVSGFEQSAMVELAKHSNTKIVLMHHLGIPANKAMTLPENGNHLITLHSWAKKRIKELTLKGIHPSRMIFDPGIGFGKTARQSMDIMTHIDFFQDLHIPVMVGHSRKSCFNLVTDKAFAERDIETLTASLMLKRKGVDYLRVHNVAWHKRSFAVEDEFTSSTEYIKDSAS